MKKVFRIYELSPAEVVYNVCFTLGIQTKDYHLFEDWGVEFDTKLEALNFISDNVDTGVQLVVQPVYMKA